MIKIFVETNVFKFSATRIERLIRVNKPTRNAQGEITGVLLYEPGYINPNEKIQNPELRTEADLLPQIADIAKAGKFQLLTHREAMYEGWGLPNMNSATGDFYDALVAEAEAPIKYGRALFYPRISAKELAKDFFAGIQDKRYRTLAKISGAYQGDNKYNLNQLRDAFYLWCAEYNDCECLLTLDFKFIKMIRRDRKHNVKVKVVRPSELLEQGQRLK